MLLMVLMLVNSGCERSDVTSAEVLEKSTDIETTQAKATQTEATQTEATSSETILEPVLVQELVEEIMIEGNQPVLNQGRLKLDGLKIVDQLGTPIQLEELY